METLRDWECFDADSGKDLAVELREYFIPDFSHWKEHDPFPGPSLVIVVSGAATLYRADDCTTPEVVPAGSGFVENGGDVHLVRNEGNVNLVEIVVSLIPTVAMRRIDKPRPRIE